MSLENPLPSHVPESNQRGNEAQELVDAFVLLTFDQFNSTQEQLEEDAQHIAHLNNFAGCIRLMLRNDELFGASNYTQLQDATAEQRKFDKLNVERILIFVEKLVATHSPGVNIEPYRAAGPKILEEIDSTQITDRLRKELFKALIDHHLIPLDSIAVSVAHHTVYVNGRAYGTEFENREKVPTWQLMAIQEILYRSKPLSIAELVAAVEKKFRNNTALLPSGAVALPASDPERAMEKFIENELQTLLPSALCYISRDRGTVQVLIDNHVQTVTHIRQQSNKPNILLFDIDGAGFGEKQSRLLSVFLHLSKTHPGRYFTEEELQYQYSWLTGEQWHNHSVGSTVSKINKTRNLALNTNLIEKVEQNPPAFRLNPAYVFVESDTDASAEPPYQIS